MSEVTKWGGNGIRVRYDSDDWLAGIVSDFNTAGTSTRYRKGFTLVEGVDPFRTPGYITPGRNPEDATNVSIVDGLIKNGVVNGTVAYLASASAKLHSLTVSTTILVTPTTFPHSITGGASTHSAHTTFAGEDVALYYLDSVKYLFYSYNDNTDGGIGRYDLSTTFDDDYVDAVATSGAVLDKDYPHPMIVGDDDILYIGDGKDLASLQGTTSAGIFNASALDLPNDYIITSFSKSPNYLIVYAYKVAGAAGSVFTRSEATAFFWDYVSDSFTYAVPLQANYVNGGFVMNGQPGCFVQGQSADSITARQSKCILVSPLGTELITDFNGDIPGHGGVEVSGKSILFNSGGVIYRYGSPYTGFDPSLNEITTASGTTGEGMLKNFFNTILLSSAGTTTSGGLERLNTGFYGASLAWTTQTRLPNNGRDGWRVAFVRAQFRETIAAAGRGFQLKLDGDHNQSTSDTHGTLTTLFDSGTDSATIPKLVMLFSEDTSGNSLPRVDTSIGLFLSWLNESPTDSSDAAQVESVEIYLEPLTINQE